MLRFEQNRAHQHMEEVIDQRLLPSYPMENNFLASPRFQQDDDRPSSCLQPEDSSQFGSPYVMPFVEATEDNWDAVDSVPRGILQPQIEKEGSEG